MIERLPIRAVMVVLIALFVWWLWPADKEPAAASQPGDPVIEVAESASPFVAKVEPRSPGSAVADAPAVTSEARVRFEQARRAAFSGDTKAAMRIYQELIDGNKEIVEPYINLAALYAQSNQLDRAQQTLTKGLNANENYATLFTSLQQVLGALAANAYQDALEQGGEKIAGLQLPSVSTLGKDGAKQEQISLLQEKIASLQNESARASKAARSAADDRVKLQQAESELAIARQTIESMRADHRQQLAALQNQLTEQSSLAQNLLASNERLQAADNTRLSAAQEESLQAQRQQAALDALLQEEKDTREKLEAELLTLQQLAKEQQLALQKELAEQKQLVQQQEIAKLAEIEQARQEVRQEEAAKQKEMTRQQQIAMQAEIDKAREETRREEVAKQEQLASQREIAIQAELDKARAEARQQEAAKQEQLARQQELAEQAEMARRQEQQRVADQQAAAGAEQQQAEAVALINSWAAAWSRQAVDDYVSHYVEDYTPPGENLTHPQWLEQRRVRLTNKSFIDVAVSDFDVRATAAGFDVTFTQHYKSNTMDDVIRKRLSFTVDSSDWSSAKIIGERVIR